MGTCIQVPKRKPTLLSPGLSKTAAKDDNKPLPPPKKFAAFQGSDSRAVESGYQRLLEEQERQNVIASSRTQSAAPVSSNGDANKDGQNVPSKEELLAAPAHVQVNEDFLFDVNIVQRELAPVYWHGPVYEVRRGTWFYQEGSSLRPCEENLAAQLEEGYLKTKPWLRPAAIATSDVAESGERSGSTSAVKLNEPAELPTGSSTPEKTSGTTTPPPPPPSYRLFGTYMNSVATYQDSTTAWLSSDGIISWVTSSVYQRFAGGGYMSGVKLVRGYTELGKTKDAKRPKTPTESSDATKLDAAKLDEKAQKSLKRKSAPPSTKAEPSSASEGKAAFGGGTNNLEEEIRQREENEISDDYNIGSDESQGRDIEHLILVTHGIGQLLSLR